MKKILLLCFLSAVILESCMEKTVVYLGQGLMAGEATESSIILQSRLTTVDTLVNGDILGIEGTGRFEISENNQFTQSRYSGWLQSDSDDDYIIKCKFSDLKPATRYFYRLHYGADSSDLAVSPSQSFMTNAGRDYEAESSLVVVTGMNYYHFHYGKYDSLTAYKGDDKALGYPALATIRDMKPDYFIGTGDNVYFDHPNEQDFKKALERGRAPHPGGYGGKEVTDEAGMRRKYHEQLSQMRFRELFAGTATYWEKDDHDYRKNDADPFTDFPVSHELGIKNFKEQLPVIDPTEGGETYRTRRINRDLQLWFVEGRDFRDANDETPGADKTLWGKEQIDWLKKTLLESDATFKLLISPTPLVGPDDASKKDNHVNPDGFRDEGDAFFEWLIQNDFLNRNFYIVCGDRHWQYHARHPSGIEEYSCGALVDNNSRVGRLSGDPKSTDPEGGITQFYIQGSEEEASGGFLYVNNEIGEHPALHFLFYDERGKLLYQHSKSAN